MLNGLARRAFSFVEVDYREVHFGEHYLEPEVISKSFSIKVWSSSHPSDTKYTIVAERTVLASYTE